MALDWAGWLWPDFFSDCRSIVDSGIRRVNTQMRIAVLAEDRLWIDSHGYRTSLGYANLAGSWAEATNAIDETGHRLEPTARKQKETQYPRLQPTSLSLWSHTDIPLEHPPPPPLVPSPPACSHWGTCRGRAGARATAHLPPPRKPCTLRLPVHMVARTVQKVRKRWFSFSSLSDRTIHHCSLTSSPRLSNPVLYTTRVSPVPALNPNALACTYDHTA